MSNAGDLFTIIIGLFMWATAVRWIVGGALDVIAEHVTGRRPPVRRLAWFMGGVLLALIIFTLADRADAAPVTAAAPNRQECTRVSATLAVIGATRYENHRLTDLSWREAGCVDQNVHRSNDWTDTRWGFNACDYRDIPKARRAHRDCRTSTATIAWWERTCDLDPRNGPSLEKQARCALKLWRMGPRMRMQAWNTR